MEEALIEGKGYRLIVLDGSKQAVRWIEQVIKLQLVYRDAGNAQHGCLVLFNPAVAEALRGGKVEGGSGFYGEVFRQMNSSQYLRRKSLALCMDQDLERSEAGMLGGVHQACASRVPPSIKQKRSCGVEDVIGRAMDAIELDQTGNPYSSAAMMYSTARPPLSVRSMEKGVAPSSSM